MSQAREGQGPGQRQPAVLTQGGHHLLRLTAATLFPSLPTNAGHYQHHLLVQMTVLSH